MFLEGHFDVLHDRQRGEEGAVLEQDAPAPLHGPNLRRGEAAGVLTQQGDPPGRRPDQADDGPQEDRFARTRTADHAHDLAGFDQEFEAVVDHLGAELSAQAAHLDGRSGVRLFVGSPVRRRGHQMPSIEKMMEKSASSTITRKIASTTAAVVRWPTDSALIDTLKPS